jgi:uncharacterized protein (DUF4415 family)
MSRLVLENADVLGLLHPDFADVNCVEAVLPIRDLLRVRRRFFAGDDSDINFDDIPSLAEEQLANMVRFRDVRRKVAVSVRLDPQVLDWLKSKGEGHLTRINDILANLMEAERAVRR